MSSYTKTAMRHLGKFLEPNLHLFSDLKDDLKKSRMRLSIEEYLSTSLLTCIILFVAEVPLFSFIFSLLKLGILFSIFTAITVSLGISILFFLIFLNYPKFIIGDKAKSIERTLPFAGIYLSAIASSGLPLYKVFEIFSKFDEYGDVSSEAKSIVNDMSAFGLSIKDSLKKAVDRTPSKELRELFWSILSSLESGGNLSTLLDQKSKTFLGDYKRKLEEFSKSLRSLSDGFSFRNYIFYNPHIINVGNRRWHHTNKHNINTIRPHLYFNSPDIFWFYSFDQVSFTRRRLKC